MIRLETDRLLMREFLAEDAEDMYHLNNDPEVMQYTGDIAFANSQEALDLITKYDQYRKYQLGRLTIIRKIDGAFLGWCGLKFLQDTKEVDLGYRFKKQFWGKGYATEACYANLQYGFSFPHINVIIGRTRIDNTPSIRVLEKMGMKFQREFLWEGMPSLYYQVTKNEFQSIKINP